MHYARLFGVISILMQFVVLIRAHGDMDFIDDEDDFDDYDDFEKPLPQARNPIRTNNKFVQDRDHLKHHLSNTNIDLDKEEGKNVEFHFFSTHDLDKNGMLDGLELYMSMEHGIQKNIDDIMENAKLKDHFKTMKVQRLYSQLENTVDRVLEEDDKNGDGYMTYTEFAKARLTLNV